MVNGGYIYIYALTQTFTFCCFLSRAEREALEKIKEEERRRRAKELEEEKRRQKLLKDFDCSPFLDDDGDFHSNNPDLLNIIQMDDAFVSSNQVTFTLIETVIIYKAHRVC